MDRKILNDLYESNQLNLPLMDRYSAGILNMHGGVEGAGRSKIRRVLIQDGCPVMAQQSPLSHIYLGMYDLDA